MCRAVTCNTCGKTTWAGCGQHVSQVKTSVGAKQWCGHTQTTPAKSGSVFGRLFGR